MVTIRRAGDADVAGIVELNRLCNGDDVAAEVHAVVGSGHVAAHEFAVAVEDDQVVSTVGLLAMRLRLDDLIIPAGQPEFVATGPGYRGQGLMRRLLEVVQSWSTERGDLVQIIAGIPFLYRRFGYSYGLLRPIEWLVPSETEISCNGGWEIRAAVAGDIPEICVLQEAVQAGAVVSLPFSETLWPTLLALPHAPVLVAVRDGRVEAAGRLRSAPGQPLHLQAVAMASSAAGQAFIAGVRRLHPGRSVVVGSRAGVALSDILGPAVPVTRRKWLYVRIADPAELLRHVIPVLENRLAGSSFASASGRLLISFYRSGVTIEYSRAKITVVEPTGRDDLTGSEPDVHLPPDLLPRLLFGTGGVLDWETDPDVDLGRHRDLMAVLLPPVLADVLIW